MFPPILAVLADGVKRSALMDMGADFEKSGLTRIGKICQATARLFPQRAAVDFATVWLAKRTDSHGPPF